MFVRLLSDQIEPFWSGISQAVEESLVSHASPNGRLTRILESVLTGSMQVWVLYRIEKGKQIVKAIVVTVLLEEEWDNTKSLLVYAVKALVPLERRDISEMKNTLRLYALDLKCIDIKGYVHDKRYRKLWESFGGKEVSSLMWLDLRGD